MDRRTFLKTSTAAAAVTTAGAAVANETMDQQRALLPDLPGQGALGGQLSSPAIATQRHELRFAIPAGVHLADAAETLSREIAAASGGRILLHNRPDEPATATSLASGLVDATFGFISEVCTSPDLALFSGLPGEMALSPSDMLTWHTAAAGDMFLEQAADAFGLIAMIAGHGGAGTGIWADRELGDLRDFASAHVTTTGLGHDIVNRIRAAYDEPAITDASHHLVEHTASPLMASLELTPPQRAIWYRQGIHRQGQAGFLFISRAKWGEISPGDQLLIRTIARAAAYRDLANWRANDRLVAPNVLASLPTKQQPLPHDIDIALQHTARAVVHDITTRNPRLGPAFEAYQAFYQALIGSPLPKPAALT